MLVEGTLAEELPPSQVDASRRDAGTGAAAQSGRGRTLPPEAHREPSGDTVTVLMYPVWPRRSDRSLQFVRFHTCGRMPWQSRPTHAHIGELASVEGGC